MITKKKLLVTCSIGVIAAAITVHFLPRYYYRYHAGHVYLVNDSNTCWNGLRKSPTLQFAVPLFANAKSWTPTSKQVRTQLWQFDKGLSELEISSIIQSCVACGRSAN